MNFICEKLHTDPNPYALPMNLLPAYPNPYLITYKSKSVGSYLLIFHR